MPVVPRRLAEEQKAGVVPWGMDVLSAIPSNKSSPSPKLAMSPFRSSGGGCGVQAQDTKIGQTRVHRLTGRDREMLGEIEAVVLEVTPFEVHGLHYYDVTIALRDRSVGQARLGAEAVPAGLEQGEQVLATMVAGMVISLRRP